MLNKIIARSLTHWPRLAMIAVLVLVTGRSAIAHEHHAEENPATLEPHVGHHGQSQGEAEAPASPVVPASALPVVPASAFVTIGIDAKIRHQVMEGFGATTLSLLYGGFDAEGFDAADNLSPELRTRAIKAVYGEVGITMGNLNLPTLERRNDDADPLHLNANGFDTRELKFVGSSIVGLGKPYGFENYSLGDSIDFRFMPWLAEIRKADYNRYLDECAEHVLAGFSAWRDAGYPIPRTMMLFNEPLSGNGELQGGSTQEVVDIVKRAGARLRKAGFDKVKFVVPGEETEAKTLETATAILADAEARPYVAAIAYHPYPYGSTYASVPNILKTSGMGKPDAAKIELRRQLRELGSRFGVPVWMSEVSHGEVPLESMDALRGRAIHIHDELQYADAAAYYGMNAMWDSKTHQEHTKGSRPIDSETDTIALIDDEAGKVTITGMGYAIGHYARWVKRGAVRIEATTSDPLVLVSAFRDEKRRQVALVLINNSSAPKVIRIAMKNVGAIKNFHGEQSTETRRWKALPPIATVANSFSPVLPAQSVSSFAGRY